MSVCHLSSGLFADLPAGPRAAKRAGFTLVELLIVISIIAILASLVAVGLAAAKKKQEETEAKSMVSSIRQGLDQYYLDEGDYPASRKEPDAERNDFPELYRALMDRDNPYLSQIPKDDILVMEADEEYRTATREEVRDTEVDKYVNDPWGNPYVYRCNKYHEPMEWMENPKGVDVYSLGPNGMDDTIFETPEDENDDIH